MVSRSPRPTGTSIALSPSASPVSAEDQGPYPVVSLRESSIVTLASHGVLDADQVAAAWRFRKAWEVLADLRRPSRLFERVDCAFRSEARIECEDEARRELAHCRQLLGAHGFDLLVKVCAEGWHIRDLYSTRRERDTATDLLRIHLDSLVELTRG